MKWHPGWLSSTRKGSNPFLIAVFVGDVGFPIRMWPGTTGVRFPSGTLNRNKILRYGIKITLITRFSRCFRASWKKIRELSKIFLITQINCVVVIFLCRVQSKIIKSSSYRWCNSPFSLKGRAAVKDWIKPWSGGMMPAGARLLSYRICRSTEIPEGKVGKRI